MALPSNSKDGRRMSRTMQRMADQFELDRGLKYGTYKLPKKIEL